MCENGFQDSMMKRNISFFLLIGWILISCSSTSQSPSQVVSGYLDALVNKDSAKLVSYSCKNWETEAQKELDSFSNVGTSLENVACKVNSQNNVDAAVICSGFIKLTYDTEIQKIDLSKRVYQLVFQNNEWRICDLK
jgi:hypothetical protein